ncbi:MAG TPA: nuclear transport factor 2 family protein, partial [Xanthomonadales bacterium]|nr:nuclear transport factor 2 family protein [Xanthomonadales bacterium]
MDQEKPNRRRQLIANLSIVAGLVLVGVQLMQNSEVLKLQLLYEESQRSIDIETLVIGEDAAQVWAKSLTDTAKLTLAEQRIMEAMLWSYTENLRANYMLSQYGLLEEEEWRKRVETDTAFYLANPYARAWWSNYSADSDMPEPLKEAINARLAAASDDFTSEYMQAIMTELAESQKHASPGIAADPDSPESRIRAARERYNNAIETQQLEGMAILFAPDYHLISGRGDRRQGPQAQLEMWRKTFEEDPTFNCQRTPEEVNVNADWGLARETGHWLCTQTVEGTPAEYTGV